MTYYIFTLVFFLFEYFILAMGLNIQYGEAGILNFAYIGFVALGAYVTGVTALPSHVSGQFYILGLGLPFPVNTLLGGLAAMAMSALVAVITLRRLRTDYLAIVLISLSLVFYDFCNNYVSLFNGADGLYNVPEPFAKTLGLSSNNFIVFFACLTGVISLIVWFVMNRVMRAPLGRTFRAVRDDHVTAAALGKNPFRMQLKAMMIGSFFAGIGGGLLIQFGGSFNPTAWLPGETFVVFAVLLVGGVGNNIGMLVGALLVETLLIHLPAFLPEIPGHPGLIEYFDLAVVGIVLMLFLWFRPQGIVPTRMRRAASFGVTEKPDGEAGDLDQTSALAGIGARVERVTTATEEA
ncbi:MAG: branched-chain amino acid ABC transporter permease [Solirubrobacteraceae bacterium]